MKTDLSLQQLKTKRWPHLYHQLYESRYLLLMTYLPVGLFLIVITIGCYITDIPLNYLARDPASTTGEAFYLGFLSNIGALLWCATATICLFTYFLFGYTGRDNHEKMFWLISGLFNGLLLFDDFFLLHESTLPYYFDIPEKLTLLVYGLCFLAYFALFPKMIFRRHYWLFLTALAFWGGSFVGEWLFDSGNLHALIEDGGKLLGITGWFAYFALIAIAEVGQALQKGK